MNFAEASVLPLKRYAEFHGRSTRTELVAFYLLTMVASLAVRFAGDRLGPDVKPWLEGGLAVSLIVPTLALSVRRLHDWGRSGWWMLVGLPFLVSWIWEMVARPRPFALHIQTQHPWWVIVPVALCVLALYALLLWDDDVDTNKYGPNPRGWTPGELA